MSAPVRIVISRATGWAMIIVGALGMLSFLVSGPHAFKLGWQAVVGGCSTSLVLGISGGLLLRNAKRMSGDTHL